MDRQTDRHAYGQINRYTDRHAYGQINRYTDRHRSTLYNHYTWNPSNVQLANFMEQTCWSNGKYSTSMKQEDLNMAELSHVTPPSEEIITLVLNIPIQYFY